MLEKPPPLSRPRTATPSSGFKWSMGVPLPVSRYDRCSSWTSLNSSPWALVQTTVRARPEETVFLPVEGDGTHGILAARAGQPAVAGEQQEGGKREQQRGTGDAARHECSRVLSGAGFVRRLDHYYTYRDALASVYSVIAPCPARRCDRNRRLHDPECCSTTPPCAMARRARASRCPSRTSSRSPRKLDEFGVDYIEGGWPGLEPEGRRVLPRAPRAAARARAARRVRQHPPRRAARAEDDPNLQRAARRRHAGRHASSARAGTLHVTRGRSASRSRRTST